MVHYIIDPTNEVLDAISVGLWGPSEAPKCEGGDLPYCLIQATRSTKLYRSLFFVVKYIIFWDLAGPIHLLLTTYILGSGRPHPLTTDYLLLTTDYLPLATYYLYSGIWQAHRWKTHALTRWGGNL